jgi:hypothetical protein
VPEVTGLLSEEGKAGPLALNLRRVWENVDGLVERLVAAAIAKVESEFDVIRNTELLEHLFDSLT